jgi:hypothetical protein
MSVSAAFTPMGNTVQFTAAVSPPSPVQALSFSPGANQYRFHNTGDQIVYLGWGANSATATSVANISLSGATITLIPGSVEILSLVPNSYFTGATATGNSVVTVLVGDGI